LEAAVFTIFHLLVFIAKFPTITGIVDQVRK